MTTDVVNPPCPKCKAGTNKLNFDGYGQLYECTKFGCMEQFRVAAGRVFSEGSTPPQTRSSTSTASGVPRTRSTPTCDVEAGSPETNETKEKPMAVNEAPLICRKECGKTFTFEAWREKHEAKCGGAKTEPKPAPKPAAAKPRAKKEPRAGAGRFADAIQELRVSRIEKEQEIAAIDTAIEALEKLG